VLDEGIRLELGKDFYFKNSGIDEVVEDKVDNSVLTAEIHGGFRPFVGERVKPRSFASGHDHSKNIGIAYG
jgi:hypothetical protein